MRKNNRGSQSLSHQTNRQHFNDGHCHVSSSRCRRSDGRGKVVAAAAATATAAAAVVVVVAATVRTQTGTHRA